MKQLGKILIAVFTTAGLTVAQGDQPALRPSISVFGTAETRLKPDLARIQLVVISHAPAANEALDANVTKMHELIAVLKEQNIPDEDVQTSGLDVATSDADDQRQQSKQQVQLGSKSPKVSEETAKAGYRSTHRMDITVRDLSRLGMVLEKVARSKANRVDGIEFEVADPRPALQELYREAIAEARHKAEVYASAAMVQLGPIRDIKETEGEATVTLETPFSGPIMPATLPVSPGQLRFQVAVTICFEIAAAKE